MINPIEEIKNRLDIVDVVGSYIKLQKAGINYRGLCPFHSEKKPSFFVSPSRQIWHCFGACSEGGDIFKFVMKIEGVEFGDALRILAKKAGVELKTESPELRTQRQRLYEICELTTMFFEKQLDGNKKGKEAREYLFNRNINKESLKKWRIGYSPESWSGLSDFLIGKGYKREEVEKTGLAIKKENGGWYDRFRGRIMFPISDSNSQIIGFTGRVFGDKNTETAKYINTPNTLLYDKSCVLYGLDKAKMAIRKNNQSILVEGQVDVIMSHQAGEENIVATSGTALTATQLGFLKRYSDNLIIAFDTDIAGDSATKKGIDLAQESGFNIRVITMPEGSDPADVISAKPSDWNELIKNACSILEFYFESAFSKFDAETPEGKKDISKILLPALKRIPNKIEQSYWIQELAKKLKVRSGDIDAELKKCSISNINQPQNEDIKQKEKPIKSRKEMLEQRVISLILNFPEKINLVEDDYFQYFSQKARDILADFKKDPNPEKKDLKEMNYLFINNGEYEENIDVEEEINVCLSDIKQGVIKKELDEISLEIKKNEDEKKIKKVDDLIQKFNQLTIELTKKNG
ncbi:MAG: DNA primase [Patescibacteria group bacterium]|nr:DNA primase [Patescibacteria group bacterium]